MCLAFKPQPAWRCSRTSVSCRGYLAKGEGWKIDEFTLDFRRLALLQVDGATGSTGALVGALIASLAFDPRLLDPLHAQLREWQAQSEAELDPAAAAVVRLATHALWTNDLLLTNAISPELLPQIVARLEALTYPA